MKKALPAALATAALALVVGAYTLGPPAEAAKARPVFNRTGPIGIARGQRLHVTLYNGDLTPTPYGNVNIKMRNAVTGGVESQDNWETGILRWEQVDVLGDGTVEVNGEAIPTTVGVGEQLQLIAEISIPTLSSSRKPPIGTLQLVDLATHHTLGVLPIWITR